jgi:hypothetical protein
MRCSVFIIIAAIAAFSSSSASALAQQAAPSQQSSGGQKPDLQEVKRNIAPLAGAFGVTTPAPPESAAESSSESSQSPPAAEHKTIGDVADKALGDVEQMTGKIAGTIEKLAPKVWEIMVRQQYAKAFAAPLPALAWIASMFVFSSIVRSFWKKMPGDEFEMKSVKNREDGGTGETSQLTNAGEINLFRAIVAIFLPTAVVCISILFLFGELRQTILYLINPEYYAVQDLLSSIMSGGQAPPS